MIRIDLPLGNKKLPGQLPKPQQLVDLFAGTYVAYQGFTPGSIDGRIDVYLKRPNSNTIEIVHDVPADALKFRTVDNRWSSSSGVWVLMGGPEGVPTLAQDLLGIMPEVFQRAAEDKKMRADVEAKNRLMQKTVTRTQDEQADALAEQTKKIANASKPSFFEPQRGRGDGTSLKS